MKQKNGFNIATGKRMEKTQDASKLRAENSSQTLVNFPENMNKAGRATIKTSINEMNALKIGYC